MSDTPRTDNNAPLGTDDAGEFEKWLAVFFKQRPSHPQQKEVWNAARLNTVPLAKYQELEKGRDSLRRDLCDIAKGCGVGVPDQKEAKRRIIAIASERDELRRERDDANAKLRELVKPAVQGLLSKMSHKQICADELSAVNKAAETMAREADWECGQLRAQIQKHIAHIKQLQSELLDMVKERDTAISELATARATIAELEKDSWTAEIQQALGFIPNRFCENDAWQNGVKRMAEHIEVLEKRVEETPDKSAEQKTNATLYNKNEALKATIAELEADKERKHKALEQVMFYYNEWNNENPLPKSWPHNKKGDPLTLFEVVRAAIDAAKQATEPK